MQIHTREHYDIIDAFEKAFNHLPTAKESKELWPKGHVYCNGEANNLFLAYRQGYAAGRAEYIT